MMRKGDYSSVDKNGHINCFTDILHRFDVNKIADFTS